MTFHLAGLDGDEWCEVPVRDLVVAGWTGRDQAAVEAHIRELEKLGVARPTRTPIFYRVGASLLTTAPAVDVMGGDSSGEVEFILLNHEGVWHVGVGSDHTDRKAETAGVTLAKQLCPKPLAPEFWNFDEVESHWDELMLRSYAVTRDGRALYQEGLVSAMRHPRDLIASYARASETGFVPGTVMFCGTLPVKGGIRWADTLIIELEDPVLKRRIAHSYTCRALPLEG
jgi:hypothetical protein